MSNFHVGQKVVCVDASDPENEKDSREAWPVEGEVYTIRSVEIYRGGVVVRLHEIRNPRLLYRNWSVPTECNFRALRFRPVVERSTDISIFTKLLTPSPCKETA